MFFHLDDPCHNVICIVSGEICDELTGLCRCGEAKSCENKTTGSYCDQANSLCKCNATIDACTGTTDRCTQLGCTCGFDDPCSIWGETCQSGVCMCRNNCTCKGRATGEYCDALTGMCKCSSHLDACSGEKSQCLNGNCIVANDVSCKITNEIRQHGTCRCGSRETCEGIKSGSFCDPINSLCKCTSMIEACSGTTDRCSNVTNAQMCTCGGDVECNQGETCVEGTCMCGNIQSCKEKLTGSYCDKDMNTCKCSAMVDACNGTTDRCINGACTCGGQENFVCNGTSDGCINGECKCGQGDSCIIDGELCIDGRCLCGKEPTCEGKKTGSYCDVYSGKCKCSRHVEACTDGNLCINGTCGEAEMNIFLIKQPTIYLDIVVGTINAASYSVTKT